MSNLEKDSELKEDSIFTKIEKLIANLEDPRSKHGIRFAFKDFMMAIILGVMCGHKGYRELGRFMENNKEFLQTHLNFKDEVPKYVIIRYLLMKITNSTSAFNNWISAQLKFDKDKKYWCSADGKVLGSTLTDPNGTEQSLIQVVSIYCAEMKSIVAVKSAAQLKKYEGDLLLEMLSELKSTNLILTLDALHCIKKT